MAAGPEEALDSKAKPTWYVLILLGAIVTAAFAFADWDAKHATAAAQDVIHPMEIKLDTHLAEVRTARQVMENFVDEDREFKADLRKKVDALCRANPKANCPL